MSDAPIQVLLVEDDSLGAAHVARILKRSGSIPPFEVTRSVALQQAVDTLGKRGADVALLDLTLPDSDGVQTVRRLRDADAWVPIVVVTGAEDQGTALGALKAGAQDYLVKGELDHPRLLVRTIRYAIERQAMRRDNELLAEQFRQSERMVSLGALVGGMSLGFSALLGNVLEQTEAALAQLSAATEGAPVRRNLVAIRREVMRACQMTDQLRDYSGNRAAIPSHPIDLSRFVSEVSRTLDSFAGRSARIGYELARPGPVVFANRLQLYQVAIALVANGIEAIGERAGEVRVATGRLDADRDLLNRTFGLFDALPGTYAFLQVTDTGCGMDVATRRQIFDPFFTTKPAGRGLGLAAVVGIARQLGAGILVESSPDRGTVVRMLLPLLDLSDAAEATPGEDVTR